MGRLAGRRRPGQCHHAREATPAGQAGSQRRCNAYTIGDYHDPFVTRLWEFGIESVYAVIAKPGSEEMVIVQAGTYGGLRCEG